MKLFKDQYNITLEEVSMMFETDNIKVLSKYSILPIKIIKPYHKHFMIIFSEMFNSKEIESLIEDDNTKLRIIHRVYNILTPLYWLLLNYRFVSSEKKKLFKDKYKEIMGRDYNSDEDLKLIIGEIKRLKEKLTDFNNIPQKVIKNQKVSFEEVITYTENVLERTIDRRMKLFQFKREYDLAVKKAKQQERKHGRY